MSSPEIESKKRKRSAQDAEELEIDVSQPEPLSRKDARRAKKGKSVISDPSSTKTNSLSDLEDSGDETPQTKSAVTAAKSAASSEAKRSDHGIWIGNLAFSVDRTALRAFLTERGGLADSQITRIHMPTPNSGKAKPEAGGPKFKPSNKGFAYVDLDTTEALAKGLALTETLLIGRRVLIKDAKSFSGRPEKKETDAGSAAASAASGGKPPSKRVFVGNLAFDVTKDMLQEHFAQAGAVEHIHMATFEDTGKCKGFAWVTFADLEAAKGAVLGYILKHEPTDDDDDDDDEKDDHDSNNQNDNDNNDKDASDSPSDDPDGKQNDTPKPVKTPRKKPKPRKWFINRINGRSLRCEYAEDSTTRYNKRYRSNKPDADGNGAAAAVITADGPAADGSVGQKEQRGRVRGDKHERAEQRRKKHADARLIRPGAALANAPRASGAIVEGAGTKVKFDD